MQRRSTIELTFREATDTSPDSSVAAGVVVDWIDKTAYACAASWTRTACVTTYVGNMHFTVAIPQDTPVTVQARVVHTGRTSVHVQARVLMRVEGAWHTCTECFMIYVALGDDGEPAAVPSFTPSTELERRRDLDATRRMAYRWQVEEEIRALPSGFSSSEAFSLQFLTDTDERYPDGKIRGGEVMKWIDAAAEICAGRYCGYEVTSVLTGGVRFHRPITNGDLVEVDARLVLTGTKSMHVLVRVRAGSRWEREHEVVAYGIPVMVSPDGTGRARPITRWEPINDEDHQVAERARRIRDLRNASLVIPGPHAGPNQGVVRPEALAVTELPADELESSDVAVPGSDA